ncbi:MAG: hypothetical protein ACLQD8_02710 [Thermoplasmata archaeon]
MAVPGPPDALWATALIVWALSAAVLGEAVRFLTARWVPMWRTGEPVERFLLDFYLGGAALYLLAAVPVDAFGRPVVFALPIAAGAGLLAISVGRGRSGERPRIETISGRRFGWAPLVAVASALVLYGVELGAAMSVGTGNTFDSSLLTTYTALLLQHGHLPISFRPYATPMILYPQGTTVWLGAAQLVFGLPPARTSLLVTPLFLSLVPLSGFVLGRRLFGTDRAGAAVALSLAFLGPATRSLVGGSNDLALAFPLVLLLAARSTIWTGEGPPRWGDALGFGLLLGYSAALNPVGAEWLFPALILVGLVGGPRAIGRTRRWLGRWTAALAAGLLPVVPSLYVLFRGLGSPGFVPGAARPPSLSPTGISPSQLLGSVDPFLFRAKDLELSPLPLVRAELAILLVVGLSVLLLARRSSEPGTRLTAFARWAVASGVSIAGWFLLLTAAGAGWPIAREVAQLSSGEELSIWLFTLYGLIAAVPLVLLFDRLERPARPAPSSGPSDAARFRRARTIARTGPMPEILLPLAASLAVLAPGLVLTPTELSPVLRTLYADFGTVSPEDFALLACAGANLPAGSRVLVAPGSAAEFLPGYAREITLLYPLMPEWQWANASYRLVVRELTNATLDAAGEAALASLHVDYIAVTLNNTVLWPAFSPEPLRADPSHFAAVFESGDAYLYATTPGAPPFPCA